MKNKIKEITYNVKLWLKQFYAINKTRLRYWNKAAKQLKWLIK